MNYEYGKEYECNGVSPDLPDDVLVRQYYFDAWMPMAKAVEVWASWSYVTKFRIEDTRYKPTPEQGWYDYENQVAVGLPPVGAEVEVLGYENGKFERITLVAYNNDKSKFWYLLNSIDGIHDAAQSKFRPLDWDRELKRERDELIKQAMTIADKAKPECDVTFIEALIDAGWRPQEQKK